MNESYQGGQVPGSCDPRPHNTQSLQVWTIVQRSSVHSAPATLAGPYRCYMALLAFSPALGLAGRCHLLLLKAGSGELKNLCDQSVLKPLSSLQGVSFTSFEGQTTCKTATVQEMKRV